jgi:hypothetical protein
VGERKEEYRGCFPTCPTRPERERERERERETFTHIFSHFLKKKMHVHVFLKILVNMKNCDLIFIGELKILNT